ncbi:MAG: acyl-ACP--UDP-N-acetylglucosamine O-acyltransferase [Phycisphaeraceae bacterium]
MPVIHPSSVVESGAELADDVVVGPLCYVAAKVRIGAGTRLVSHVTVLGRTTIGRHNLFWPHTTAGGDPQDLKFRGEDSQLIIGDHNEFRENVTLHKGTDNGGGVTRMGSHGLFMIGAHIAHDCLIGDHVILANSALLAGHVLIEDHAVVSGATAVHHFVTIGRHAFIGGMTRVIRDCPPYMIVEGMDARVRGVNVIGLERTGYSPTHIANLKTAYKLLYRDEADQKQPLTQRLDDLQTRFGDDPNIATLITFTQNMVQGLFGRYRETLRTDARHRATVR